LSLPKVTIEQAQVDWTGLPKRFLNPGELETLVSLMRSVSPRTVIEFGCNVGRTARALIENVDTIERYVGIDVLPGYRFSKAVQRNEIPTEPGHLAKHMPQFHLIVRRRGSFELAAEDLPKADAVFIDGDHSRAAVLHDTELARRLVQPGGLIIWHDYHDLGTVDVRAVLDELHAAGAPICHAAGTWIAFEKVTG
jgi:predicted O-methyltransferase YrrM